MKKLLLTGWLFMSIAAMSVAQNVGIGTNSPAEKLHVTGNIKADTVKPNAIKLLPNAGSGKVLTSDGSGNASWQALSASSGDGSGSWGDCSMNGLGEYEAAGDTSGAADDHYGYKVAISGDFAIVGTPFDDVAANADQGSASFYHFNGTSWDLMQKITEAGGVAGDVFGACVSISGDYAIVGIPGDDIGANTDQGSAIIYHYNGTSWVMTQKITDNNGAATDYFGISASMDGNFLIVGANADDFGAQTDQGSACIFQNIGGTWTLKQKIFDISGLKNDNFGQSVSISGSNLIVGEPGDDVGANADQGSVLFYYYNGTNWIMRTKLNQQGQADDEFGFSVSISGNNAVIGCPLFDYLVVDGGAAFVYHLNGANWDFAQRIVLDDMQTQDEFGYSVNISGEYLMVGAPNAYGDTEKGIAGIYQRIGVGWAKVKIVQDKMGVNEDLFGFAVAFDANTKRFLVSAYGFANFSGKIVFGRVLE